MFVKIPLNVSFVLLYLEESVGFDSVYGFFSFFFSSVVGRMDFSTSSDPDPFLN